MSKNNATPGGAPAPLDRARDDAVPAGLAYGEMPNYDDADRSVSGTSIFDPVLCEIAYRWFSPPGGIVLDPFAGGSVRGIVAAKLGRRYTGVDLSERQIQANRQQWREIRGTPIVPDFATVKISAKNARLAFNGCDPDYIRDVCHASCCDSKTSATGTLITIHPSEETAIEKRGGVVLDGLLQPKTGEKKCPFKNEVNLCGLHFTPDKPFGCIASPFTLNDNNTLIVRNRYKLLKCYNDGPRMPAYKAFRASLDLIFGLDEAERICNELNNGCDDINAQMPIENWKKLQENDDIKHGKSPVIDNGRPVNEPDPQWIAGDSRQIDQHCAHVQADLVFSCPPYADLERYSDDPADLSTMNYQEFKTAYFEIVKKACNQLKQDSFACFVVGEVRDKQGNYIDFVGDTVQAFRDAGLNYYNEGILVTAVGSLPIRVGKQFSQSRKLGKTHQNILVFVKGNPKAAAARCGDVELDESMFEETATGEAN